MPERIRHILPHFIMLLVAIFLYWCTMQIDVSNAGEDRIGPDFWPKVIVVFMGLLCLYEIIKRLVLHSSFTATGVVSTHNPNEDASDAGEPEAAAPEYLGKLLVGAALIFGFVIVVPYLGFFTTSALFLFSFQWIGGMRKLVTGVVIALLGALVLLILFMRVAYISLPLGVGPFQDLSVWLLRLLGAQ